MIGTYHNIALCRASCPTATPMSHQLTITSQCHIIYFQVQFISNQLLLWFSSHSLQRTCTQTGASAVSHWADDRRLSPDGIKRCWCMHSTSRWCVWLCAYSIRLRRGHVGPVRNCTSVRKLSIIKLNLVSVTIIIGNCKNALVSCSCN